MLIPLIGAISLAASGLVAFSKTAFNVCFEAWSLAKLFAIAFSATGFSALEFSTTGLSSLSSEASAGAGGEASVHKGRV
jgi:hypothetical protein